MTILQEPHPITMCRDCRTAIQCLDGLDGTWLHFRAPADGHMADPLPWWRDEPYRPLGVR